MKIKNLLIVSATLSTFLFAGNSMFAEKKAQCENILEDTLTCVQSAKSPKDMKVCKKLMKEKMKKNHQHKKNNPQQEIEGADEGRNSSDFKKENL